MMASLPEQLRAAWNDPYEVVLARWNKGGDVLREMEEKGDTGDVYEKRLAFRNDLGEICKAKEEEQRRSCAAEESMPASVIANFDGLCEPWNPGGYACGGWCVAPLAARGLESGIRGSAFYLRGDGATNNVAEYRAAIDCLAALSDAGYRGVVQLRGDSQLVVKQAAGDWQCNKPHLIELRDALRQAMTAFERVDMVWVPREQNEAADQLSREAYQRVNVGGTVRTHGN